MDEIVERKYPTHIRQAEGTAAVLPAADHHRLELLPVPADRRALLCLRFAEDQLQEVPVRRHHRRRHRLRDLHLSRRLGVARLGPPPPGFGETGLDILGGVRLTREVARAVGRIEDPHLPAKIESRRPIEARQLRTGPRKRARNSGSSRRSNSRYGCMPLRSQPRDRAIEPRRIERVPHHDFAAGMEAHAAALPHRDQHGVRRQSIAHELRALAIAPFHALQLERVAIAGGARADDAKHHGRDRNQRRPCSPSTAGAR